MRSCLCSDSQTRTLLIIESIHVATAKGAFGRPSPTTAIPDSAPNVITAEKVGKLPALERSESSQGGVAHEVEIHVDLKSSKEHRTNIAGVIVLVRPADHSDPDLGSDQDCRLTPLPPYLLRGAQRHSLHCPLDSCCPDFDLGRFLSSVLHSLLRTQRLGCLVRRGRFPAILQKNRSL